MKIKFFMNPDLKSNFDTKFILDYIKKVYSKVNIDIELVKTHKTLCIDDLEYMSKNLPPFDGLNILFYPTKGNCHGLHTTGQVCVWVKQPTISFNKKDLDLVGNITAHEIGHACGLNHQIRPEGPDKEDPNEPDEFDNMIMQYKLYGIPSLEKLDNLTADELFPIKPIEPDFSMYEIPNIGYPINTENVKYIANCFCWSTLGERENTFEACVSTYNANDTQGYKHSAVDFAVGNPNEDNWFINPFKEGIVKIDSMTMKFPDDYGQPYPPKMETLPYNEEAQVRKGSRGNYIQLKYFKDGNPNHNYPANVITCYGCHLKQNSNVVKVGDIVQPGQKLAKIGWSGYSSKQGAHLHFELKVGSKPADLFEAGVFKKEDFNFKFDSSNRYPKWYKKDFTNRAFINNKVKVESEFFKEYTYTIKSDIPIYAIMHNRNPFGEVFEYDLLEVLRDKVKFDFSNDKKVCEFKFIHKVSEQWLELSKGEYSYYIQDEEGNKTEPFVIEMI